jgi:hypothetical protein
MLGLVKTYGIPGGVHYPPAIWTPCIPTGLQDLQLSYELSAPFVFWLSDGGTEWKEQLELLIVEKTGHRSRLLTQQNRL